MDALKPCPHCAENIKLEARVCRYCGRSVVESSMLRLSRAGGLVWRWLGWSILGSLMLLALVMLGRGVQVMLSR